MVNHIFLFGSEHIILSRIPQKNGPCLIWVTFFWKLMGHSFETPWYMQNFEILALKLSVLWSILYLVVPPRVLAPIVTKLHEICISTGDTSCNHILVPSRPAIIFWTTLDPPFSWWSCQIIFPHSPSTQNDRKIFEQEKQVKIDLRDCILILANNIIYNK